MTDFINTIDALGDVVVTDSVIDRSITEFKDNILTNIGRRAFEGCSALETIELPSVTRAEHQAFCNCSSLKKANLPLLATSDSGLFNGCTSLVDVNLPVYDCNAQNVFTLCKSLVTVCLPKISFVSTSFFAQSSALRRADLPNASTLHSLAFNGCTSLSELLLRRTDKICSLSHNNILGTTLIAQGTGYVYVPKALIEDYKVATNWSTYANQFRALEDYTVDGTTTGKLLMVYKVTNSLARVSTSNIQSDIAENRPYTAVLTSRNANPVEDVTITMGGFDITVEVYNAETGEIDIPAVIGDVTISARAAFADGENILENIGFNAGYINNNGAVVSGAGDVHTDKFNIAVLAGKTIMVKLYDVGSPPNNSRIVYYNSSGGVVGSMNCTAARGYIVANSTVPATAYTAAISINKSSGFSLIEIIVDDKVIGELSYTS